jgi:hypothetical protein
VRNVVRNSPPHLASSMERLLAPSRHGKKERKVPANSKSETGQAYSSSILQGDDLDNSSHARMPWAFNDFANDLL